VRWADGGKGSSLFRGEGIEGWLMMGSLVEEWMGQREKGKMTRKALMDLWGRSRAR
jgi:hypothetical protein